MSEEKASHNTQPDLTRDKAIRLFTYLRELVQLRSKVIRTLDNYDSVLFFSDIPCEPECFTQAWGYAQEGLEEIWLKIEKPKFSRVPPVPNEIRPWVIDAELADSSKDDPELCHRIFEVVKKEVHSENTKVNPHSSEPQSLDLKDHLHILKLCSDYIERKWKPWAKEDRRLKKVQKVYAKLFTMHQKLKSLGEEFELVVGFGLLNWQTPSGQMVHRHLITCQATIKFGEDRGTLSVVPPAEGAKPELEQDMLEPSELPIPEEQGKVEQQVKQLDDIWNIQNVEIALRSWVHSVSAEGNYSGELVPPLEPSTKPFVTYSPALILRKRTERGLIRVYGEIIKQLEGGVKIPSGVERVVEIKDDRQGDDYDPDDSSKPGNFREIFFPLPANDEQLRIVENLYTRQGVLVQGPPGTGKSHTIVNLICHLLATGQRVLVTSHTARALKVLKDKILKEEGTKEIAPLCVSLLGNDSAALKDLKNSVEGITNRNWDSHKNALHINELRQKLDELKKREAILTRQLREVRERETYEHNICEGAYWGTAQRIAQQVSVEKPNYGWLQMQIALDKEPPLTNQEVLKLLNLYRELTPEHVSEIEKPTIPLQDLPTPEEFVRFKDLEAVSHAGHNAFAKILQPDSLIYRSLKAAGAEQRERLQKDLSELLTAYANVLSHSQPWVGVAFNDILSSEDRSWRELYRKSSEHLNGLLVEARTADERHLTLPPGYDRAIIMNDAKALLDHLKKGGRLRRFLFSRPKPVKSARYLIKETRVDGRLCDNVDSLKTIIATLSVDEHLDKLWSEWKEFASRAEGSRTNQVGKLEGLYEPLEAVLKLHELLQNAKDKCVDIDGLPTPAWHNVKEVEYYLRTLEGILSEENLEKARVRFTQTDRIFRTVLTKPDVHPVVTEGHHALTERDEQAYCIFYEKILALDKDRHRLEQRRELDARLRQAAPALANRLAAEAHTDFWDKALTHFVESWRWAQANTWLREYIEGASEAQLDQEIKDVQNKIGVFTGRLAAASAWRNCFNRMTESERAHLKGFKQAMNQVGKGYSKFIEKFNRDVHENMEGCRSAIPAWIMPLYRVAETVDPATDAFDVVIIDEASQAGPDAAFLLFIAKKIIVVGDDMQISPESIGISPATVNLLIEKHIRDLPIPQKCALGVVETSFFHLAEILFSGRICLGEHFRCMPEIIQFSNNLCYQNKPLVPLRQYPPNRLTPVVIPRHVLDGYREGGSRTPRNPPEAQAIADTIAECCKNPVYDGKTMGVISLLGEHQAQLIQQKLLQEIGPEEMERRNLICGDAYAFQGDERDIMFLSLVAAPGETSMRALAGQKDQRRFNVAASRARDQMWLFHTPTINDFRNKDCLRYKLLSYCQNPKVQPVSLEGIDIAQLRIDARTVKRTDTNHPAPFDSWFEVDVFLKITEQGYRVLPQFEVAGYFIDLVVEGMRGRLAVECDGDKHHGLERYEADMARQRQLERCNWTFWRIRGGEFYYNPDMAMESLWELLKKHRIAPGGQDVEPNNYKTENNNRAKILVPKEPTEELSGDIHSKPATANTEKPTSSQLNLFGSQNESVECASHSERLDAILEKLPYANRSEMLEAILAVLPPQGTMMRNEAIRVAARLLKDNGRIEFQRIREDGYIWNEFKSAINSGIRSGLLEGDNKTIWRRVT